MKKNLFYLFIALTILSCRKVIEIDIADKERKIVINSFFTSDSVFKVNTSQSLYVMDSAKIKFIENARVSIYEEGIFIESLTYKAKGNYYSATGFKPSIGKMYKVTATAENLTSAEAVNSIPQSGRIISIDTSTVMQPMSGWDNMQYLQCKIKFSDPAQTQEYYMLHVLSKQKVIDYNDALNPQYINASQNVYFSSDDLIIDQWVNWGQACLFSDKMINGTEYSLTILLEKSGFTYDTATVFFYLSSISKEYYLYANSLAMQSSSDGPFSEPVLVYNNVTGGYGIFAGYTNAVDSIKVFCGNDSTIVDPGYKGKMKENIKKIHSARDYLSPSQ